MRLFSMFDDSPQYSTATFPTPRPFQEEAHEALRQGARNGHRCQMLMAPTGSGKTFLGLRAIHEALQKGKRAMFICDRRTLIEQTSAVSDRYGLTAHSVMMADHWKYDRHSPFQIASAQTLARRQWPDVDLIVIDEAHVQMAVWAKKIPTTKAHVIGLSATPFSDGLGKLFSNLVCASSMHALTESGVLVPMRVFSCTRVDMHGAATAGGEWTDGAAAERGMQIIGDVVSEWKKFASDRKTIVFGATIKHCEEMARQFNDAGVMAACFTSDTDQGEREMLLAEYRKPDSSLRVLLSVNALAKGFDVPDVSCVVDVRPLRKSLSEAIQMWGRGLRSSPSTGKQDCLLLDFCIATGQRVLTTRGLVPIQEILLSDRIWDGHEFVSHSGVISRGIKPIIEYAGLKATPCHPVKTAAGWRTLGDCAEKQTAIVSTGIGRATIRECEGYFTGPVLARKKRSSVSACAMRVRWMRVQGIYFAVQLAQWIVKRVPRLQSASTCPEVALCANTWNEAAVPESEREKISRLWRSGDRVPFRVADYCRPVDHGESRNSGKLGVDGTGSHRQQRTLRAGEYSVGEQAIEYGKSPREQVGSSDAQIHSRAPGNKVFRGYAAVVTFFRNVIRRYRRSVSPSVMQTEGEVWDILDCGPRNSFTCEGLLVHNSGNIVRMADDFADIYYNGLDALDQGEKLDKTIRRDNDEKPEGKACPQCGYQPCGRRCVSCGYEHQAPALIEHEAGTMQEIMIGGKKYADDKRHLWEQACTYARGYSIPEKQLGRARHIYRDITGEWPDHTWSLATTQSVPITRAVFNKIKSNNIRWAKARGLAA